MTNEVFAKLELPYQAVVLDKVLDGMHLADMMRTWPKDLIGHFEYPGGIKRNFNGQNRLFRSFVDENPAWAHFEKVVIPNIKSLVELTLATNVLTDEFKWEFSELPPGGGLLPHPDTPRKVMTAVVYMPPNVWHPSWGGEFEICRHRTNPEGDFRSASVPWVEVETVMAVPYQRNRIVAFLRRPNSLHGVRPVRCPVGFTRDSLTINWISNR